MVAIVCVDDKNGTMFNHRRQSQDRVLRKTILEKVGEKPLYVSPYTAKQFSPEQQAGLIISDSCLTLAGPGEYCFAEGEPVAPHLESLEEIVLYRWNRAYPANTFFDITIDTPDWTLIGTRDFQGSSHDQITEESIERVDQSQTDQTTK